MWLASGWPPCPNGIPGYTADSQGYILFLEVLDELDTAERKDFLEFATGCPSLPPGGLANLHPRLTVVKKTVDGDPGLSYPSVNTCHHYVKMPEYSTRESLKGKLLRAVATKGFHLN